VKSIRLLICLGCALSALLLVNRTYAATLFASTAAGDPGRLYSINPATGAVIQDIGPLNDATGANYPVTGLAFHPTTGVLYGSSANASTAAQATLVTIDPITALVTVIGAFNAGPVSGSGNPATMADLSFDPTTGNLYGIGSVGGPQLYSINTLTGQATVVGATGLTSTSGGGLAISSGGIFYGTPTSSRFGTYNSTTGAFTNIANPTKPVGGAYAALAFDGSVLYGLDLGPDSAGKPTHLVTIDQITGAVTPLGGSIAQLDAIAFQPVPEPASMVLLFASIFCGLLLRTPR
jgi:hypothetical protein